MEKQCESSFWYLWWFYKINAYMWQSQMLTIIDTIYLNAVNNKGGFNCITWLFPKCYDLIYSDILVFLYIKLNPPYLENRFSHTCEYIFW